MGAEGIAIKNTMSRDDHAEIKETAELYQIERITIEDIRAIKKFENLTDEEAEELAESVFTYSLIINEILKK